MSVTRRRVLAGSAAGAASLASGLASPAIAANETIKIGYLPALTGPSSSTGVGITRGTELAVADINAAGGINGRKIELIVRDTQSDPTKAVNAVAELTQRQKASMIWGPLNSGESLAATPLIARDKVPMLHPCWVDELIDVKKYPMAFRQAPTNTQVGGGANYYVVDVMKLKKVAVISDTTGYGTASANTYIPMLKAKGAEVVYTANIDAANPDLKPDMLRMQSAGAQVIMPWSVNAGFLSRILNMRGAMGWDVPVVGQTTLGSGQTKALLEKPEYWNKVYSNNFRSVCLCGRQAAATRRGVCRPAQEGKDRIRRHAPVVGRARLGRRDDDKRYAQGSRNQVGRHRRLPEQGQGMAGRLRHRHLDPRTAQRLPRPGSRDVRGQLAEGRRVQPGAGVQQLEHARIDRLPWPRDRSDLRTDRHHV